MKFEMKDLRVRLMYFAVGVALGALAATYLM